MIWFFHVVVKCSNGEWQVSFWISHLGMRASVPNGTFTPININAQGMPLSADACHQDERMDNDDGNNEDGPSLCSEAFEDMLNYDSNVEDSGPSVCSVALDNILND